MTPPTVTDTPPNCHSVSRDPHVSNASNALASDVILNGEKDKGFPVAVVTVTVSKSDTDAKVGVGKGVATTLADIGARAGAALDLATTSGSDSGVAAAISAAGSKMDDDDGAAIARRLQDEHGSEPERKKARSGEKPIHDHKPQEKEDTTTENITKMEDVREEEAEEDDEGDCDEDEDCNSTKPQQEDQDDSNRQDSLSLDELHFPDRDREYHEGDELSHDCGSQIEIRSTRSDITDDALLELLSRAAAVRGVPLEVLLSGGGSNDEEDEEGDIEYPFGNLPTSLEEVADFINSDKCRSIVVLAGAGMSVASGIPDFRSADGLYATMNPDLLTANTEEREAIREDPTVALEQGMFIKNPLPCLELNRTFILGTRDQRWKATLAHRFVELLYAKTGKLARLYTQNIDGLEDQCTQLPRDRVIAVHGSMDRAECAVCGEESDFEQFCDGIQSQIKDLSGQDPTAPQQSTPLNCSKCGSNALKPAIVLFRASLPTEFFQKMPQDVCDADLLIVIGTSLRVAPANSLVYRVPKKALRLVINREPVGFHLGMAYDEEESKRDYFALGDCDDMLLELMSHLGWLDDLKHLLDDKLPDSSANLLRNKLQQEES